MLDQLFKRFRREPVVRLSPQGPSRGAVALSYILEPFVPNADLRGHTNAFECHEIAKAFLELGFRVEIVDYRNRTYQPPADTRVAIDIHSNLERWAPNLPDGCRVVLHATGAHWLTWNAAEFQRLLGVFERRGRCLAARRTAEPSRGIEVCEVASVIGNDWTMGTFAAAGKPMHRVLLSSAYTYDWAEDRDFEAARRKFVWLGSFGMVHKGLDLALDAFSRMPEYELTVCGRPEKEHDFFDTYRKELTGCDHIHLAGWTDLASPEFDKIRRTHAGMIYPSSSEGCAGSIVHCTHAGLVPIVTRETGFDIGTFGSRVSGGNVEAVCEAVRAFAESPASEIRDRARAGWEFVRETHNRERFCREYRAFAADLVRDLP